MGKIYYVKVPSCGYIVHCVVPWEVFAWLHRVPSFPSEGAIVCLCSPCQSAIVCLCSPCQDAIVCPCRPLRVPHIVPKIVLCIGVSRVCQGRLSHDTRVCKVAHLKVPSCAKVAHVKVPA